mgnify:CR=1 FL=1
MKPHWVSVYLPAKLRPAFEYHGPWWISGETMQSDDDDDLSFSYTICAWVMATDGVAATETLRLAIDADQRPASLDERFSKERPMPGRDNPSGRFEFADWMKWPWPLTAQEPRT